MIIKDVSLETDGSQATLLARCKIRRFGWDTAYFKIDKKYLEFIAADASAFAAALLIPSMRRGENLRIKGSISAKLYQGMQEVIKTIDGNFGLREIGVRADKLVEDNFPATIHASYFSGGVDSFYTYLKHKSGLGAVSHFILINGYDIDLRNKGLWEVTRKNVREIAEREGIEVIEVESNIKNICEPIVPWQYFSGGGLSAVALALRAKICGVYLPCSYSKDQQILTGSCLELDPLWSTETLGIIHDGVEARRVDKVMFIADSPLVQEHLRVCYKNLKGVYNCGKCDKCLRTMISLKIAGALEQTKTFPNEIDLDRVRATKVAKVGVDVYHRENLEELEKLGIEPEIAEALRVALVKVEFEEEDIRTRFVGKGMYLDHIYSRGLARRLAKPFFGQKF